jgi:hypothetical protein
MGRKPITNSGPLRFHSQHQDWLHPACIKAKRSTAAGFPRLPLGLARRYSQPKAHTALHYKGLQQKVVKNFMLGKIRFLMRRIKIYGAGWCRFHACVRFRASFYLLRVEMDKVITSEPKRQITDTKTQTVEIRITETRTTIECTQYC